MKRFLTGALLSAVAVIVVPAAPVRAETKEEVLLESIGTFSAGYLYQTYLGIGVLADAKAKGAYEDKTAGELLQTTLNLIEVTDKQLEKLLKQELGKDEKDYVGKLKGVNELLKDQAGRLKAYWLSKDVADATKFEEARKKSWSKIAAVLGIKE